MDFFPLSLLLLLLLLLLWGHDSWRTVRLLGSHARRPQTISFVERGFERLGLDRRAVGFSWCSYVSMLCSPMESFSWRWAGRLWFLAIFPSPPSRLLIFPFIFTCVHCPSSTCRASISKVDICPISLHSKSLGVVVKA